MLEKWEFQNREFFGRGCEDEADSSLCRRITDKLQERMESVYGPMKVDRAFTFTLFEPLGELTHFFNAADPKPRAPALRTQSLFDPSPPEKKNSTPQTPKVPKKEPNSRDTPAIDKKEKKPRASKTPRASAKKVPLAKARKLSEPATPTPEFEEEEAHMEREEVKEQKREREAKFISAQFIVDSSDDDEVGEGWKTRVEPGAVGRKRRAPSQQGRSTKRRRKLEGGAASVGEFG